MNAFLTLTDLEFARTLVERATATPWVIRPRDGDEFRQCVEPGDTKWRTPPDQAKALRVASRGEVDVFLGWELDGPTGVGRGDFNGPDAALVVWLVNNAPALLALAHAQLSKDSL